MAKHCESLGFERFWVSEHHAFQALAGSAPEVLLAAIGAATREIRIGSGGVMLPHYSAYKVAEQFSMLANLYPGRIDLGIGRAPGADMSTAVALARSGQPSFHDFHHQVEDLSSYLWQDDAKPLVSPMPPRDLPLWMLGSSPDSGALAAQRGLPYNLGGFINTTIRPAIIKNYRRNFQASRLQDRPYAILAIGVFCADTEQQAKEQQHTFDVNFYRFITGQSQNGFLPPEQAMAFPVDEQFQMFVEPRNRLRATGTPDQVKRKIEQIAQSFDVDEVMAVSNIYHFEERKKSFALLKSAFE